MEKSIKPIKIGGQRWMSENLDVSHFSNGDPIPYAQSKKEWFKAYESDSPACCDYNFNPVIGKKFGKLYNWYAVADPRGLAPNGWRVATIQDWESLGGHLGNKSDSFFPLYGGYLRYIKNEAAQKEDFNFEGIGQRACLWAYSEPGALTCGELWNPAPEWLKQYFEVEKESDSVFSNSAHMWEGLYVRCIIEIRRKQKRRESMKCFKKSLENNGSG